MRGLKRKFVTTREVTPAKLGNKGQVVEPERVEYRTTLFLIPKGESHV